MKRRYTVEELAFVREQVGVKTHAEIAATIHTTRDGLRRVLDRLNLRGCGLTRRKGVKA